MHPSAALHDPGWGHPEHQGRLRALLSAVRSATPELHERVTSIEGVACEPPALLRVHDEALVERVRRASEEAARVERAVAVDEAGETRASSASWEAATGSAGALIDACVRVGERELANAFVATRPPGHHATRDRAMGFCLFNSVAVAARALQAHGLAEHVLIVDWDVHHGNGTQDIFYDDPTVFYLSLHQDPLWPGTGAADERGEGQGRGTTMNVPVAARTPRNRYLSTFQGALDQVLSGFTPDFVLISAGYDALAVDPLSDQLLEPEDFRTMTELVAALAADCCGGRVVAALEGGYDPAATGRAALETIRVLSGVGGEGS